MGYTQRLVLGIVHLKVFIVQCRVCFIFTDTDTDTDTNTNTNTNTDRHFRQHCQRQPQLHSRRIHQPDRTHWHAHAYSHTYVAVPLVSHGLWYGHPVISMDVDRNRGSVSVGDAK